MQTASARASCLHMQSIDLRSTREKRTGGDTPPSGTSRVSISCKCCQLLVCYSRRVTGHDQPRRMTRKILCVLPSGAKPVLQATLQSRPRRPRQRILDGAPFLYAFRGNSAWRGSCDGCGERIPYQKGIVSAVSTWTYRLASGGPLITETT